MVNSLLLSCLDFDIVFGIFMKVLVTLPKGRLRNVFDISVLNDKFDVVVNPYDRPFKRSELVEAIRDVEGLVLGWDVSIDKDVLAEAEKLKIIGKVGAGLGNVDVDFAFKEGIIFVNTQPAYSNAVAEYTIALILDSLRNISLSNYVMKMSLFWKFYRKLFNRTISIKNYNCIELCGKTVGLVGYGGIAHRLVELLKPFNCKILVYDPYMKVRTNDVIFSSLNHLLSNSDVVSIHAPLNKETKHMIGVKEFEIMKKGVLIVNTARADIIDMDVFYRYLKLGRLRAALDVFSVEPLPYRSVFRKLSNVIITPHQAGNSLEAERRHGEIIVSEFERYSFGKDLCHKVTPDMLKTMSAY